jgi:hypothetical protein
MCEQFMRLMGWSRSAWAAAALVLALAGCGGWQQVAVVPSALGANPGAVRITKADGSRVVLEAPRLSGDSLYGRLDGQDTVFVLADVERMAVPDHVSARGEAAITFFGALAAAFVIWWVILLVE